MSLRYSSRSEAKAARRASKKRRRERAALRPELHVTHFGPRTKDAGQIEPEQGPRETEFHFRNRICRWLNFRSYAAYLRSALWKAICARLDERDYFLCAYCGQPRTCHHHERYTVANMTGVDIKDIKCACEHCHRVREFDDMGVKTGLGRALYMEGGQ